MKVLDLFSGIGGFSLGLKRAGMETVAFCEIDPYCRKVLAKHWPDVPIHEDITELNGSEYTGTVELICGGFPCQPFSTAGKRAGADDNRYLWPEMLRVITQARPAWVIGENVAGIINMGLDTVLFDLESEGYTTQTFVIPACAVDAPHRRDRIWIIAHSDELTNGKQYEHETTRHNSQRKNNYVEDTISARLRRQEDAKRLAKEENAGNRRLIGSSANTGKCLWPLEPGIRRMANGIPSRVDRVKGLGNAVVPQIPEIIGRAIKHAASYR